MGAELGAVVGAKVIIMVAIAAYSVVSGRFTVEITGVSQGPLFARLVSELGPLS
jgi:hypothetical protein